MEIPSTQNDSRTNAGPSLWKPPHFRKYTALIHKDLRATYSRDLHKWLVIAPIVGVTAGLLITLIAKILLNWMWPPILRYYLAHPLVIVPTLTLGFIIAGLIMQYFTPDPDEHSTEEVIRSYHEHEGDIRMRPFLPKLLAAIATVGFGGSAALEGPSIYGGGALGSWLWAKLRGFRLEVSDRRIMLISGAAAGMSAVFRAPLTGIIFALEMPYKDDLAHEALLPSLIASVVSFATMASFLGAQPLFDFRTSANYSGKDLLWSALLGAICGIVAMVFDISFRRFRTFVAAMVTPHWIKMAIGGLLTGACGVAFLAMFKGNLIPIGPNYEAVAGILQNAHGSAELVLFGILKLLATLFSLGVGGVSAMFVPLFLTGGCFGTAFAQSIVRTPSVDLYAAVGMAAFIAGGYKTPLTAVVFVAEATGGHSFIIPALIGAAVAYAVSGEASVSGDQKVHEGIKIAELRGLTVHDVMQKDVVSVDASSSLREFSDSIMGSHQLHAAYPVYEAQKLIGLIVVSALWKIPVDKWKEMKVRDLTDHQLVQVRPECDLAEALSLLMKQNGQQLLAVVSPSSELQGIVTKTDVLSILSHAESGDA
jgi:chloride channel protein, CIC family